MKISNTTILFNQRKNKPFSYKPRFSVERDSNKSLEDDSEQKDFVSKWKRTNDSKKPAVKGILPPRTLIIILVLLLICMYLLETKFM